MTCLQIASNFGYLDIVDLLLDKGAEVNKQTRSGLSALYFDSGQGHGPVVQRLLDDRANVDIRDDRGKSASYHADEKNHETVTQFLLDRGVNLMALLALDSEAGNLTSLESLLAKGRGRSEQGQRGDTLLHLAIQSGNEHVVQVLSDNDADITVRNNLGRESLYEAAMFGNEIIVQSLLNRGRRHRRKRHIYWL